jgi:hypothetical protein
MSEEAELPAALEARAEEPAQQPQRPPGYDPVDLSDLPPEKAGAIKQRMDFLYRQVKDSRREIDHFKNMTSQKIDELIGGMGQMADHLHEKTFAETESQLRQQLRAAYESGNTGEIVDLQERLAEVKAEKKLAEMEKKQGREEKPQPQPRPQPQGAPMIDAGEQFYVNAWQDERDESGNLLRPWAFNRGTAESPSPEYADAMREVMAVMNSPRFSGATIEQKMAEVDRRMGVSARQPRQAVMGGGLTGQRKTANVSLSPEAERLAVRTKFGGPNAKSDAEHVEAYRKFKEQTMQKGARR